METFSTMHSTALAPSANFRAARSSGWRRLLALCALCWAFGGGSGAALAEEQAAEPMEEVVVRGERRIIQMRGAARRATREFYNLLNKYLDEPDYKIRCFRARPPAGGAVRRVCRTAFQERAARNLVANVIEAGGANSDVPVNELLMLYDPSLQVFQRNIEFNDAILVAVNTHPELNKAAHDLLDLTQRIIEAEQRPRQQRLERREQRREDRARRRAERAGV